MARNQAANHWVEITAIAVTHLNYLHARGNSGDFDEYIKYFLDFLRPIWGLQFRYRIICEGRAAALCVCEPFFDVISRQMRPSVEDLFMGLNKTS